MRAALEGADIGPEDFSGWGLFLKACRGFPAEIVDDWYLKWVIQWIPETVARVLSQNAPKGHTWEEAAALLLDFPDSAPINQWGTLGRLPEPEALMRLVHKGQEASTVRRLVRLALNYVERGTPRSVSGEKQEPLEAAEVEDTRAYGSLLRLESTLDAQAALERLARRITLTEGERIVFQGLRIGLEGEDLATYTSKRGVSARSATVLKARLLAKLRKAAAM